MKEHSLSPRKRPAVWSLRLTLALSMYLYAALLRADGIELHIQTTDTDLQSATVSLEAVSAHGVHSGWTKEEFEPRLVELIGGSFPEGTLVWRMEAPAGRYTQVRLHVGEGEVTLADGAVAPLRVPSGKLRVNSGSVADLVGFVRLMASGALPAGEAREDGVDDLNELIDTVLARDIEAADSPAIIVTDGAWTRLVLEVVADRSLHELGNGRWHLKPVLRVRSVESVPTDGPDPRDERLTAVVGPEGGGVWLSDGTGVSIAPGALPQAEPITVARLSPELASDPAYLDRGTGVELEFVGGVTLEPSGLTLAVPAVAVVPTPEDMPNGLELFPVVHDSAQQSWTRDALDDDSSLAVALGDGHAVFTVAHFSSHGVALPETPLYEGCELDVSQEPESLVHVIGSPGGVDLYTPQTFGPTEDLLEGIDLVGIPGLGLVDGMNDDEFRKERYRDALFDLVLRTGLEGERFLDTLVDSALDRVFATEGIIELGLDQSPKLSVEVWELHFRNVELATFDRYQVSSVLDMQLRAVIQRSRQNLAARVNSTLGPLDLTLNWIQMELAGEFATELDLYRAETLAAVLRRTPLVEDDAFGGALEEVLQELRDRRMTYRSVAPEALSTPDRELAAEDFLLSFTGLMSEGTVAVLARRLGFAASRLGPLVWLGATTVGVVNKDVRQRHLLACRIIALETVWRVGLQVSGSSELEEKERQLSSAYAAFRTADLIARYYTVEEATLVSQAVYWIVASTVFADRHAARESWVHQLQGLAAWHHCGYQSLLDEGTDPAVEAALAGYESVMDDASAGMILTGPPQYWREETGGLSGTFRWTQNVDRSAGTPSINSAIWSLFASAEGEYEVSAYVPGGGFGTAQVCYEVTVAGQTSYRLVEQSLYSDDWVDLGRFGVAKGGRVTVRLTDLTSEPGLTTLIAADVVALRPEFDALIPPANVLGCDDGALQPATVVRHPIDGVSWSEANDGDGWYVAQGFAELGSVFLGKIHLGEDWNKEECAACDQGHPVMAPAPAEVIFAGDAGYTRDGVVMLRLVRFAEPFLLPGGGTSYEAVVLLGNLDPESITVEAGDLIAAGTTLGNIGPPPCKLSVCGSHLQFEVITGRSGSEPMSGFTYPLAGDLGRVDPSEFLALNGG